MGFFKNIFKKKIKTTSNSDTESEKSNFMPEIKKPTDDRFVNNFINNGGKFLYSETINEAKNKVLPKNKAHADKIFTSALTLGASVNFITIPYSVNSGIK